MVRILKVKELEDRKRFLLARSEMYRQTMRLEVANLKFSVALLKRRYTSGKALLRLAGLTPLLGGFLFARRYFRKPQPKPQGPGGILGRIFAGLQLFRQLQPMIKGFAARRRAAAAQAEGTLHSR